MEWQQCEPLRDADASSSHKAPAKKLDFGAVSTESVFFFGKRFGYKKYECSERFEGSHSALLLLGYDRHVISVISKGGFSDLEAPGEDQCEVLLHFA